MNDDSDDIGIWLEVSEARFQGDATCRLLLKGDRAYPKPIWWKVADDALNGVNPGLDTYKEIVRELDGKRVVLAQMGCRTRSHADKKKEEELVAAGKPEAPHWLLCISLRFQSPELGSR